MKKKIAVPLAAAAASLLSASLLTGCGASSSDGGKEENVLNVYNWGEYIDEEVITQFEDETGIKVVYDMFETNEEMYPVIEAGGVTYDVVCPSDYMIQRMIENNLLAEINFDNIPNYKEIGQGIWTSPKDLIKKTNTLFPTAGELWGSCTIPNVWRN